MSITLKHRLRALGRRLNSSRYEGDRERPAIESPDHAFPANPLLAYPHQRVPAGAVNLHRLPDVTQPAPGIGKIARRRF